jgi:hypothetical protein
MALNNIIGGTAELGLRLAAFARKLPAMTDDELFEAFRSIDAAKNGAKSGNGEGETEDLLLKGLQVEGEIARRFPAQLMGAYHDWKKGKEAPK